ncbi:MAG: Flp pilus assembly protein CpaB [Thermoguttaceae bacterium]|nr:Flp pilus assembly protein CpaB [Thermoguttaceae bacterium]MDW8078416.1 Flp pilus assembly protein CpaB [Thermoguttaceae bacterium]
MRNRSLILLGIAVSCGLIASVGVTRALSKRNGLASAGPVEFVPIIVAAQDIPMGDMITEQMIRTEPWPKNKIPAAAIREAERVLGRRPKTRIYANTPILENQLLAKGEAAVDPTEHIPPGYRVVSVQVDEVIGAGRLIRPGDRVDLLVFIQRNLQRGIPETVTRTVLQDVKVFAVGDQFDLQEAENKRSIAARSVSLLVTPRQAEILMLATELGSIRLSLRSHADDSVVELPGSSPRDLGAVMGPEMAANEVTPAWPAHSVVTPVQQQTEPENELPEPSETWEVRLIEGSQVRRLKLVSSTKPEEERATGQALQLAWRVEEEDVFRSASEGGDLPQPASSPPAATTQASVGSPSQAPVPPDDSAPTDSGA